VTTAILVPGSRSRRRKAVPYRYVEHTADAAFEATGGSLEEVFAAAAEATLGVVVDKPETVAARLGHDVELAAESEESLLHRFLEELVFLQDARGVLLRVTEIRVARRGAGWHLLARLAGERADPTRHALLCDVKAVTWHGFGLTREGDRWRASVLLDV